MRRFALLLSVCTLLSATMVFAQNQPQLTRKQVIESADANQDGRIGRVEFLNRMKEAFFFVDVDKDGNVTVVEYQRSVQGADAGRFAAADRNKDGRISMDEVLKAISADFDAADKNDDGVLDDEEIKAWIAR